MRPIQGLPAALAVLSLCLCASAQDAGPSPSQQEAAAMDAAMRSVEQARSSYRLAPDDVLDVSVYQDKDMDRKVRVDADGAVSLPLVGAVKVGGCTLQEAQKAIEQKLSAYVVNPQVSLIVESYGRRLLFVLGEVQKPGPYPIASGAKVTVLQAITDAGGFTRVAAPRRTHVLRNASGRSEDLRIDVKSLIRSGKREKDLVLEPNDVVYVPQSVF